MNAGTKSLNFDPDALAKKYKLERDKRVRPDGNDQYREVVGEFAYFVEDPYLKEEIERDPLEDEVERGVPLGRAEAWRHRLVVGVVRVLLVDEHGDAAALPHRAAGVEQRLVDRRERHERLRLQLGLLAIAESALLHEKLALLPIVARIFGRQHHLAGWIYGDLKEIHEIFR